MASLAAVSSRAWWDPHANWTLSCAKMRAPRARGIEGDKQSLRDSWRARGVARIPYVQIKRQSTPVVSNLFLLYPCDTTSAVVIKHSTRVRRELISSYSLHVLVHNLELKNTYHGDSSPPPNLPPTSIMHNLLPRGLRGAVLSLS